MGTNVATSRKRVGYKEAWLPSSKEGQDYNRKGALRTSESFKEDL